MRLTIAITTQLLALTLAGSAYSADIDAEGADAIVDASGTPPEADRLIYRSIDAADNPARRQLEENRAEQFTPVAVLGDWRPLD